MSDIPTKPPSVSALASVLIRRDSPAARPENRIAIARPSPRARVLVASVLLLLLALAAGVFVLGRSVGTMVEEMRASRSSAERLVRERLPADAVLLDEQGWRREAAARPLAAANLHLARCRLLAESKRWTEIESTITAVALTDPGELLPATRLLGVEALLALGRADAAAAMLHDIDATALDGADRATAADLAARVWQGCGVRPRAER